MQRVGQRGHIAAMYFVMFTFVKWGTAKHDSIQILLINLYAKVYNIYVGCLCATPLASVGHVSLDEGITQVR
jgi:hypothetical protein